MDSQLTSANRKLRLNKFHPLSLWYFLCFPFTLYELNVSRFSNTYPYMSTWMALNWKWHFWIKFPPNTFTPHVQRSINTYTWHPTQKKQADLHYATSWKGKMRKGHIDGCVLSCDLNVDVRGHTHITQVKNYEFHTVRSPSFLRMRVICEWHLKRTAKSWYIQIAHTLTDGFLCSIL